MTTDLAPPIEAPSIGAPGFYAPTRRQTYKVLIAPIKVVVLYLALTYILFIIGPLWSEVDNKFSLSILVSSSYFGLFFGFYLCTMKHLSAANRKVVSEIRFGILERLLFTAGSLYFVIWSANQIVEFGILSPTDLLSRVLNPGEAYAAKFDIFEMRVETQRVSRITQILLLSSIIFALYIPITMVSWPRLTRRNKTIFLFCSLLYALSFLAIGTLKGIGDLFIFIVASSAIMIGRRLLRSQPINLWRIARRRNKVVIAVIVVFLTAATSYMIINQKNRVTQFGIVSARTIGDIDQSIVTQIVGREWAMGIFISLSYPTHGYAGLSFAMSEPYVFAGGAGIAPAFESYRFQYFGGERRDLLTYPARAEYYSGWTNGMYWSTAIALIASDVSFFGVPILFFLIGYAFSRTWIACLYSNSYLAFSALPLFFLFSFFIPANNQVLAQRQGFIIVLSLVVLAIIKSLSPKVRR